MFGLGNPGDKNRRNIEESLKDTPFPILDDLQNLQNLPDGTYLATEVNLFRLMDEMDISINLRELNFFEITRLVKDKIRSSAYDYLSCKVGNFSMADFPKILYMDICKLFIKDGKISDAICYEIDGEEHFGPVNFGIPSNPEKEFIQTVFRDVIKDKLIAPIRIATWSGDGSIQRRIVNAVMS